CRVRREPPWLEPRWWTGPNFSRPSTRAPRADRWWAAALPIPPRPITITSWVGDMVASSRRRRSRQDVGHLRVEQRLFGDGRGQPRAEVLDVDARAGGERRQPGVGDTAG